MSEQQVYIVVEEQWDIEHHAFMIHWVGFDADEARAKAREVADAIVAGGSVAAGHDVRVEAYLPGQSSEEAGIIESITIPHPPPTPSPWASHETPFLNLIGGRPNTSRTMTWGTAEPKKQD